MVILFRLAGGCGYFGVGVWIWFVFWVFFLLVGSFGGGLFVRFCGLSWLLVRIEC